MAYYIAAHCRTCRAPSAPDRNGDSEPCQVCAGDPEAVRAEEARKAYRIKLEREAEARDPVGPVS